MILEQLRLRNFGLFRGTQVFELAPAERHGRHRPIILFGGINGGGKTTIFDALQLALYGPRARCAKRANLSYDDFLRQSIHHGVPEDEGAGVWLSFKCMTDGQEHDYEVRRDWVVQEGKAPESVLVFQDGLPDFPLSRNWPQTVEELIPLEISHLFFFDGEKIRALAEDATSSAALGTAIKALLGLDIVERLMNDAGVLQARLAKQEGTPEKRAELEALEKQYSGLHAQLRDLRTQRASLENEVLRAEDEAKSAERNFAAGGGKHWHQEKTHADRAGELKTRTNELKSRLLNLAAAELPLALVPDLLDRVAEQDGLEQEAAEGEALSRLLERRDKQLLAFLREADSPREMIRRVKEHLEADRQSRRSAEGPDRRLGLSEGARALLSQLRNGRLGAQVEQAREALDQFVALEQEREDVERQRRADPGEANIKKLMEDFKAATHREASLKERAKTLDGEIKLKEAEVQNTQRLLQAKLQTEFAKDDCGQMVELAGRTRETMQEFLKRATARKIDRLSHLMTESFRFLLRKQTLVERIHIEPASFAVTLFDAQGNSLPRRRLSEGEKQIFAISMLWGLARASVRPLPAVIDTPMARLDATHRQHLVER